MFTRFTAPVCINPLHQIDMKLISPLRWVLFLPLSFFAFANSALGQETIPAASFAHFDRQARAGYSMSVVFFGGSLSWGDGASDPERTSFRALMQSHLQQKYPKAHFAFYDAAIGGTGSKLGMFRVDRDVLSHKPDLVFLDFTIEDNLRGTDRETLASYERILRELITAGVPVVQILAGTKEYFGPDWKHLGPQRFRDHLEMGDLYRTGIGNSFPLIQRYLSRERRNREKIWPQNETNPNDIGHQFIFEAARDGLDQAIREKRLCNLPQNAVFADEHTNRFQFFPATFPLPLGWQRAKTLRPAMTAVEISNGWMNEVALFDAKERGIVQPIHLKFNGTFLGILGEADRHGLGFRLVIDGETMPHAAKPKSEIWPTSTIPFGGNERFFWYEISDHLKPGRHTVEIWPVIPDNMEQGQLRIESICVAGPDTESPQSIAAEAISY